MSNLIDETFCKWAGIRDKVFCCLKVKFLRFRQFMSNSTTEEFCRWAEIPDAGYCYPRVNNITNAPRTFNSENDDDDIELCVEPNGK